MPKPGLGHNQPPVLVELTPELATFVLQNCRSNMEMGLKIMMTLNPNDRPQDKPAAIKIVALQENFKALRAAVLAAGGKEPDDD